MSLVIWKSIFLFVIATGLVLWGVTLSGEYLDPGGWELVGQTWTEPVPRAGGANKTLFVVTPTHNRVTQLADLIRLRQALLPLDHVVWVLVEDGRTTNPQVRSRLSDFNGENRTLVYLSKHVKQNNKRKGLHQRNLALKWIYERAHIFHDGVVYFADDDNTYDYLGLARIQKHTGKASIFNVGLVKGTTEGPIVVARAGTNSSKVLKIRTNWKSGRRIPIDMGGFALSLRYMRQQPNPYFSEKVAQGYQESDFLSESMRLALSDFTPLTLSESDVFVWHTKTAYIIKDQFYV